MEGSDVTAAIETAEFFLDAYSFATVSGDPGLMQSVSSSDCELCIDLAEQVRERAANGGWQEGGEVTYRDAVVPSDHRGKDRLPVQFEATYAPYTIRTADGSVERQTGERSMTLQVEVEQTRAGWRVVGVHEAR